jgi:NADH-quinone oxidoreductase subunit A
MRTDYAFIGVTLLVATALIGVVPLVNYLLAPKTPNKKKHETYECGMETVGDAWVQFRAQYYLFALIFVLFDVGGVLLFPFAVAYNSVNLWGVIVVSLFVLTLLAALGYAIKKGALEWE